jgi:hypothetical protein
MTKTPLQGLTMGQESLSSLTEIISSKAPLSTLAQKAQNLFDILYLFGRYPLYIHKLQLHLSLESRYYTDIQKTSSKHNKSKQHEEKSASLKIDTTELRKQGTAIKTRIENIIQSSKQEQAQTQTSVRNGVMYG